MALATIAGNQLTTALKPQLALLVDDMRTRLTADSTALERWRATHQAAVQEKRTAVSWTDWSEDQLTQAAVGWLLTSVFVRFCEDNLLLGDAAVWITHPDSMLRQRAVDAETSFYREHPDYSYREWLEESFEALRKYPATQSLVDGHAALNITTPSSDAVHQLLAFWRRTDDNDELVWTFRDDQLSTRFLGDLYQDLSDFAKKKYALLQTPAFVEEFILDQTMEPALKDRPLEGFKIIDPTCGSGHFLLGAFARLVERWHHHTPGLELRTRVDNALASVYGVDLNPFAVAIAKFRLIVAALQACGETSLVNAPKFTLNLANGDSLLHGPEQGGADAFDYGDLSFNKDAASSGFTYSTEDAGLLRKILAPGQYDAVVGNPPYIIVSDKALNARYREIYHYCKGKYALTVPFMEKIFSLARSGERAGWTGQITSNSFLKREFGVPLIQEFFPKVDLQFVIDSEGAWIPGHNMDGTPTVILIGRNRLPSTATVRAVLSLGLRETPEDAASGSGPYWQSMVNHLHQNGYGDEWITVTDLDRNTLHHHPWSLSGGGAVELLEEITGNSKFRVGEIVTRIGFFGVMGADGVMSLPPRLPSRVGLESSFFRGLTVGDRVRDFVQIPGDDAWFPYSAEHELKDLSAAPAAAQFLWTYRTELGSRATFTKGTYFSDGRPWYEWHQLPKDPTRLSITFAEVATHNHFVLDRGHKVFKQTAPVIKMPKGSTEDDHLQLLGTLNSSTACFWLKQKTKAKGGAAGQAWARTYQLNGTAMQSFPLPATAPLARSRNLEQLAQELSTQEASAAFVTNRPTTNVITATRTKYAKIRALMLSEQEELDWEVYRNYGLIDDELFLPAGKSPGISLGERAFEIALARKMASGEAESAWFSRHGSTPTTDIPAHLPIEYRELLKKRLSTIESNPFIRLLERPEYKRRWAGDSWDVKLQQALKDWILDKLEEPSLWFTAQGAPQCMSVAELAGHVEKNAEFIEALDLWAGKKDAPVTETLVKLLSDEAVPYLAALRYKDSGLRKRTEWERVWALQRDEDAGLIKATDIPVPPKYTGADFVKQAYWSHRGKLDVPKERFISYPSAGRATDPTPLLGWAGWNHAQQGIALATIYAYRESEGTALTELVPVVAGIAEVLPWVKQWHTGVDSTFGIDLAEYLTGQLHEKASAVGVPVGDLSTWRPAKTTRARKAAPRKAAQ